MDKWPNLSEFYADPNRRLSGEADYGVWWKDGDKTFPNYRVSYIRDTGEIYAAACQDGEVQLLGTCPPDEGFDTYYRTLDRILEGWADECGKPNGLAWVRRRLQDRDLMAGPELEVDLIPTLQAIGLPVVTECPVHPGSDHDPFDCPEEAQ